MAAPAGAGRALFIGYVWPEPNSSAAGGHMLSLVRLFLSRGWRVSIASPAAPGEHRVDLPAIGVEEQRIALNCESFDRYVAALQPDVVVFDRFMMEEQFGWRVARHCPGALRLLDTEDLHSLRHARHEALKRAGDGLPVRLSQAQLFERMAPTDLAQRELAAIYRSDLSLMTSELELALLRGEFRVPAALLHHCPFMLPPAAGPVPGFGERRHFISIGNFRHAPNWDAVLWLKQQIWPLVRRQLPDAELRVYGAYPPPKAVALNDAASGFRVLGWAADAGEVMRAARVCLAPLRFGAGIKGKLAEAMQCGTPSVTTAIGAESMCGALPWPGALAEDAPGLAEAAVRLYRDPVAWQAAQQRGRDILAARFDGERLGEALMQRIDALRAQLAEHRLRNFTGAMLQHHQHRSTQYMAQWIEAKNARLPV